MNITAGTRHWAPKYLKKKNYRNPNGGMHHVINSGAFPALQQRSFRRFVNITLITFYVILLMFVLSWKMRLALASSSCPFLACNTNGPSTRILTHTNAINI